MARGAHGDTVQTGAGEVADGGGLAQGRDDGQGPRPEGGGQGAGAIVKDRDAFGRAQDINRGGDFGRQ